MLQAHAYNRHQRIISHSFLFAEQPMASETDGEATLSSLAAERRGTSPLIGESVTRSDADAMLLAVQTQHEEDLRAMKATYTSKIEGFALDVLDRRRSLLVPLSNRALSLPADLCSGTSYLPVTSTVRDGKPPSAASSSSMPQLSPASMRRCVPPAIEPELLSSDLSACGAAAAAPSPLARMPPPAAGRVRSPHDRSPPAVPRDCRWPA